MRVLVVYAHPVETSFCAELHRRVVERLRLGGHEVDDCDLYAEGFNPVLSREERLGYHDSPANEAPVASYVARLRAAEALVLVYPVWNFGFPAMLKGYFDRVFLPGVSFTLKDGAVGPSLQHIRKLAAVTTYGADPMRAFLMGNPPKKLVTRMLRVIIAPGAPVLYLAHYDMNRASDERRSRFLGKIDRALARF